MKNTHSSASRNGRISRRVAYSAKRLAVDLALGRMHTGRAHIEAQMEAAREVYREMLWRDWRSPR